MDGRPAERKVWARLRVQDGLRVARKRVQRLMRENALLSPHRTRRGDEDSHDWQIITEAPNSMWAIDATRIDAVRDGKVRLFATVEQWNAAFPSGHVTKRGTRFEASRAPSRAVRQQFGPLSAGAARGLARRHDHGSTFMTDHVQNRVRFRGLSPGHACVAEPGSNAVTECLFRTFKEQIVHGRVFRTIDEVPETLSAFAARANAKWPIEKNSCLGPRDARAARLDTTLSGAAWCNHVSRLPGALHV